MTVLLRSAFATQRPAILFANAQHNAAIIAARGPARSLDTVLGGVWEDLLGGRTAMCLVCGGSVAPRAGHDAGGECHDCGSTLL